MTQPAAAFFENNRQRFMAQLSGGVAVIGAYTTMQRGNDAEFTFEQEANFWWLTGIDSPDWWLIIDAGRGKSWLVSPHVSQSREIFDGSLSAQSALKMSGVTAILTKDEAYDMIQQLAKSHNTVSLLGELPHAQQYDFHFNPAPKKLAAMLGRTFAAVSDIRPVLAQLRAIKQPEELLLMRSAISMTVKAFKEVKETLATSTHEYQVEAAFTHYFRSRGAKGHAYDPIVAVGANACTLHYTANQAKLKKNELLLLDIGVRSSGYAADITRTYGLGRPTKRQIEVHAAVQSAQQQIITLLKPDLAVNEYHQQVDDIMKTALLQLGLMKHKDDTDAYYKYFPHAVSHGLGVDVHDSLGRPAHFTQGMVLTVEPGIYIPEEGIGVRIEDDILITETSHENLSRALSTDL